MVGWSLSPLFSFKISSLRAELKALKTEKNETAEARKLVEEQIETIRKDHKEKVRRFLRLGLHLTRVECDV